MTLFSFLFCHLSASSDLTIKEKPIWPLIHASHPQSPPRFPTHVWTLYCTSPPRQCPHVSQNQRIQMNPLLSLQIHSPPPASVGTLPFTQSSRLMTWPFLTPFFFSRLDISSIAPCRQFRLLYNSPNCLLCHFLSSQPHYLSLNSILFPPVNLPHCCPNFKNANLTTPVLYVKSACGFTGVWTRQRSMLFSIPCEPLQFFHLPRTSPLACSCVSTPRPPSFRSTCWSPISGWTPLPLPL